MRRVGYAKIGRSIDFRPAKWGYQGDAEAPQLLYRLAALNPDVEWVVVGRNNGQAEFPYPNVTNPWSTRTVGAGVGYADKLAVVMGTLDGVVMHAGQTGTSHYSIPQSQSTWAEYYADPWQHSTTPQDWAATYCNFLVRGLNILGDRTNGQAPVVWLCVDPRNYLKARDVKWPTGMNDVLAQYQFDRMQRHERWRDPRRPGEFADYASWCTTDRQDEIWVARHAYRYGGLELMILPDTWPGWGQSDWHERAPCGVATTSFAAMTPGAAGELRRSELVRDYVLSTFPDADVCGKWDAESLKDVPPKTVRLTRPDEFETLLDGWRVTVAMPALGSSWTTAKPYQCFAARVVCFMLGRLDDQGWVLPSRRPASGTSRIDGVDGGDALYSVRPRDAWTDDDIALARWLRVESPVEFKARAEVAAHDPGTWRWLVDAQQRLLARRWDERYVENEIMRGLRLR